MAILSVRDEFCDAVALNTGGAGTYLIGSQIDTGAPASKDFGTVPIWLVINVDTAAASTGGALTVQFKLASDDSAAVHVSTSTVLVTSPVFTQAQLVAGFEWAVQIPGITSERYLGILQVTAGEAATAGKVNAYLTTDYKKNIAYPDGL